MVSVKNSRGFYRYENINLGKITISKHAFERFESRALPHGSPKSFEDLKNIFFDTLDGCRVVKLGEPDSINDFKVSNFAFYHKGDKLLFMTEEVSRDNVHMITVIKEPNYDMKKKDKIVQIKNGKYSLIEG